VAVNDPTTNYSWDLPAEGAATDTWGTTLNEMVGDSVTTTFESIDYTLGKLQDELDSEEVRLADLVERTEQLEAAAPRPCYARAYLATAESIARNVAEDLSFTEDFDKNDMFDTANPTRMTIPSTFDGLYKVRGVVSVPAATGSDNNSPAWYARIVKNGATTMAESRLEMLNDNMDNTAAGNETIIVEALVDAVAGDYFEIEVWYQDVDSTVATLNVEAGSSKTYFEIYRVRSPVVVVASSLGGTIYSTNASSTNSHSVLMPLEARQPGDILIMIFQPRANPTLVLEPSGWTQFSNSGAESAVNDVYCYYRRITATEGGGGSVSGWELSVARKSMGMAWLLKNAHPTQAPEAAYGWGTGSGTNVVTLTPSWADATFYINLGGLSTTQTPTAIPSGYTDPDVETPDPDYDRTGTSSPDTGMCGVYKTGSGAQSVYETSGAGSPSWTWSTGTSDIGTIIGIRGATFN
jgi:hypothetical protein